MSIYRLGNSADLTNATNGSWRSQIVNVDIYDLDDQQRRAEIFSATGIILSSGTDQLALHKHRDALADFVSRGGKLLVNSQVVVPFLPGLALWQKLDFHNAEDLKTRSVQPHQIFDGIDYRDLHYRTGVPGTHSYQKLEQIGVAGFYGRGFHANLPANAVVISGIGNLNLPIDYSYPLGAGEIVVHAGNDLESFASDADSTVNLGPNLVAWLSGVHVDRPEPRTELSEGIQA